jgi:hypothetical protein
MHLRSLFATPSRAPHPRARSEAELIEWQIAERDGG